MSAVNDSLQHKIVVDLAYGDSGKGATIAAIAKKYDPENTFVVRYNGGPQCAHNVVHNSIHHTFRQFGSGTMTGVPTYYSSFAIFSAHEFTVEAKKLQPIIGSNTKQFFHISPDAIVTTPYHAAVNQLIELSRGNNRHGSCGLGIGVTVETGLVAPDYKLLVKDFMNGQTYARALVEDTREFLFKHFLNELDPVIKQNKHAEKALNTLKIPAYEMVSYIEGAIKQVTVSDLSVLGNKNLLFEGAQGVLLDENYGFAPYHTWSKTTSVNAHQLLAQLQDYNPVEEIGVVRSFTTRHGAGPFVAEMASDVFNEVHNTNNPWQGPFRFGYFDAVAIEYALQVNGKVDSLMVTHCDWIRDNPNIWRYVDRYNLNGEKYILTPPRAINIPYMERMTKDLFNCTPYLDAPEKELSDETSIACLIRDLLSIKKLKGKSFGPTTDDYYVE